MYHKIIRPIYTFLYTPSNNKLVKFLLLFFIGWQFIKRTGCTGLDVNKLSGNKIILTHYSVPPNHFTAETWKK